MNPFHRWYCASGRWAVALDGLLPWVFDGVELGDDVLELGPGPGLTTDHVRLMAKRLTCLEVDRDLARKLRARMAGTTVRVLDGDATAIPLPDGSFTAVVALTMLHHVQSNAQQDALFSEACRVLRPGGTFVGMDSTPRLRWYLYHVFDTRTPVDPDGLEDRLQGAGFAEIVVERGAGRFRFRATRPPA